MIPVVLRAPTTLPPCHILPTPSPGSGITGAQITSGVRLGLGNVTCHVPAGSLQALAPWLEQFGLGDWVELPQGWKGYARSAQGTSKCLAAWDRRDSALVHLSVTQTHLESLSGEQIQALLRGLIDRNAEFTRLDPSLDDTAGITPGVSGVEAALERGDVATRAKSYNASGDRAFGGDRLGHMVTVGKRISDSYLRCYDKALESYRKACATVKAGQPAPAKPEPCTRFELELKNERAHLAAIELACADLERWPALVAGWISGHCDFREQGTGSGNITRATRLSWWASFIGNAERAYLSTPKPVQTVERAIAYVQRQLSPLLSALLQGAYGGDLGAFVSDLVDPGRPRWKARHHHLAAAVT